MYDHPLSEIGPDENSATVQEIEALSEIGIAAKTADPETSGELPELTLLEDIDVDQMIGKYFEDYPRYNND